MMLTVVSALAAGGGILVISRRLRLPGIVLLLAGGIGLGPECLGIVRPEALGGTLSVLVSLAVALILFEGGLTLDLHSYRTAPGVIRRLLSLGVLITWFGTATALWLIFPKGYSEALLAASLVIVTGPTVIVPLLRRIRLRENLRGILHWEGVLIDPIGVFIALLCYEVFLEQAGGWALANLLARVLAGLGVGVAGGLLMHGVFRFGWLPADLASVFTIAAAALVFGTAESVRPESGLLATTVAGFVLGLSKSPELKQIRQFKAQISDLLIGMLFILLAARLQFAQFRELGLAGFLAVGGIAFCIRPLNILACTHGAGLGWREKLFLSWVAPRGIVAASMASLFAMGLQRAGVADARFVETFTYSVIVITVVVQGFTAGPLAHLLQLQRRRPDGWLIVGAHAFARDVARFIASATRKRAVLLDTNPRAVATARAEGLEAIEADAVGHAIEDLPEIDGTGYILALTDNEDLNERVCNRWRDLVGSHSTFRWSSASRSSTAAESPGAGTVVFRSVPKPSLVSSEIERGRARVLALPAPARAQSRVDGIPLLYCSVRGIVRPAAESATPPKDLGTVLVLQSGGNDADSDTVSQGVAPR